MNTRAGLVAFLLVLAFPAGRAGAALEPATNRPGFLRPMAPSPAAKPFLLEKEKEKPADVPALSPPPVIPDTAPTPFPPAPVPATNAAAPPTVMTVTVDNPFLDLTTSNSLASHLLVVYNLTDPESRDLAIYYAMRRNIPADRLLAIACSRQEEIPRAEYDLTVGQPILACLLQKGWLVFQRETVRLNGVPLQVLGAARNEIWSIVLMRGVPLKIAQDTQAGDALQHEPQLQTNAAAVDSELALLPLQGLPLGGFFPNPFFEGNSEHLAQPGYDLARRMILVARLDGPTAADVRRMIDDSVAAEGVRLAGAAVIDTRGLTDVKNGYTPGDVWLRRARQELTQEGWPIHFDDRPETLPASDPCNHVALYLGWYQADAGGPWVTSPDRFVPGAVAYHLHSFSASTVRSPDHNWVGPLIAHGADATMGTVYEPYLQFTPHLDIFTHRLLQGDSFVEAAYAAEPALSWMMTVVGDPLYRPFRVPLGSAWVAASDSPSAQGDWLLLQEVQRAIASGRIAPDDVDTLRKNLDIPGRGAVVQEGLGDLLEKCADNPRAVRAAEEAYRKALLMDGPPIDKIRVGLKLAQHYTSRDQDDLAQAELKSLRDCYPQEAGQFGVAAALVPTGAPAH